MIWRNFIQPREEIIQHTPCFGIYKLRCSVLSEKLVSVPMIYEMVAFAREKGLIFRPQAPMYDSDGFFRITIGTKEENRMAVEAIKKFLNKLFSGVKKWQELRH